MTLPPLPIDDVLPDITHALRHAPSLVLHAPPGAGKTTRVPPALWDAGLAAEKEIIMLEPRRLAARGAARRIASERGEPVGQFAGYQVRFDSTRSSSTRIVAVTDGILLRRLQDDPFLENVGIVIFDEFHERNLESDVALGMVRRVQDSVRPDLKIVVMSATLAAEPIAEYLGRAAIVRSEGQMFPVDVEYIRRRDRRHLDEQIAAHLPDVLARTPGDVLVFLPGVGEIFRTQRALSSLADKHNLALMPLYGSMSPEEQDAVLAPCDRRKIVLATNVAETSVTIDGITAVIDSGLARTMQFDPSVGLDRLELAPVSQASADQRTGRAGRTQPGTCLRLWEQAAHRQRPPFETAEIARVDLSGVALQLKTWGEADLAAFPWFEPPPPESLEHAEALLKRLGAIDANGPTPLGQTMSRLPVSPRLARLLVEGHRLGEPQRCALAAALISERSPFRLDHRAPPRMRPGESLAEHRADSDLIDLLSAFEEAVAGGRTESHLGTFQRNVGRNIQNIAKQLSRAIADALGPPPPPELPSDEIVQRALLAAYPDRLAKRRDPGKPKALMVGGRGVQLAPRSVVLDAELFLCIDVDDKSANATVRIASGVNREWLPQDRLCTADELFFHPSQKQIVARRRTYWDDLILDETPIAVPPGPDATEVLFRAALADWDRVFPADDRDLSQFLARVASLREWMPELNLPAVDRADLEDVLKHLCANCRSLTELKQAPWLATIQGRFDYQQLQHIDREAPEKLTIPSGNRIRLTYEPGRPPVLAVRIQELFGLADTPRIAAGRVKVLLHLLAPNMRPQQVTDDLASFWLNTYPQVRKDLRRRYSKHPWPENPLTATPPKRKGR